MGAATLRRAGRFIFRKRRDSGAEAMRIREAEADRERAEAISARAQELPPLEELLAEIDGASRGEPSDRSLETDRRILRLRHLAGIRMLDGAPPDPQFATPDSDSLPDGGGPVEVSPGELTPELLRAAILRHGCLLVRGLVDRDAALELAAGIEEAVRTRSEQAAGVSVPEGCYEEFEPDPTFTPLWERPWIEEGGGLLAVDSPRVLLDALGALERVDFPNLVRGYLGERAAISGEKTTLRKADPSVAGAWHQDGKFLGPVRALNLWLSLSRCGDEAPGLDIVPRRLHRLVAVGTEGTRMANQVSDQMAADAANSAGIIRPLFEPGDALLFDELFLHSTASDPEMPKPRYALESWFFGPSAFPKRYSPFAT
jgi:hypothetical protein